MPFSEENVLDFVKWLEKSYFVERALGRIEKLLAPEFMMVGTGRREVCYDMPQMRFLLQQEQSGFHDTFLVLSAHYSVRTLTPEVFSVCGELVVRENNESCEMLDLPVRVTIILRAEQGCLLLSQLHLSLPSPDQDDAEFFPRLLVGENISALLRERNRDLDALMNNIPGGVMCCDATDELNLLQFSDGLLSMLGYTREELGTVFHNRFSEMIYEPDIAPTWEAVHAQLEKGNTKLIEYRMARKDGGLIWVQDAGMPNVVLKMQGERYSTAFCWILLKQKRRRRICAFRWNATKSLWIRPTTLFLSGRSNRIHLLSRPTGKRNSAMSRCGKMFMRACWTTRICILMMHHCCGARCRIFWKENPIRRRNFAFRSGTGVICGAVCVRRCRKTARVNRPKRWA